MITKKGKSTECMMSLYTKETTFDGGVSPVSDANYCSMKGFLIEPEWPDEVVSDREEITGSEYATEQEVITKAANLSYSEPRAHPNSIIGLMALVMGGAVTSTQDGTTGAYTHKPALAAIEAAMPSVAAIMKRGGIQRAYTGVKGNTIRLNGEQGGYVNLEAGLIGSGTRGPDANTFASKISESWVKTPQGLVWKESGTDISISGTLVQGAEDVSSATPDDLKARIRNFNFELNNNMEGQRGFGSEVYQDIDKLIREVSLTLELLFNDVTEIDHYLNQDNLALELDFKGAQVPTASSLFYGFQLIVPKCRLRVPPLPAGGPTDALTQTLEVEFLDDGTNPIFIFEGYNAIAAYLQ